MIDRVRFQLLGAALFAIVFPALLRLFLSAGTVFHHDAPLEWAFLGTIIAVCFGFVLLRQFISFPGFHAATYIIPCFLAAYGAVIFSFFIMRIDYSRFQFVLSLFLAIVWFYAVYGLRGRASKLRLAIIPTGNYDTLLDLDTLELEFLKKPADGISASGIAADLRADHSPDWERFLARAVLDGVPVYDVRHIQESLTGRVEFNHLSDNGFGSVLPSLIYLRLKRAIDVVAAIMVLPLAMLIILVFAVLIKLESSGPAFFLQTRMGFRAKHFVCIKLRSMRDEVGGEMFTASDDPRITKVGKFIRKYRIDELPQIFNILKGDMSWIGPRPEAIALAEWYDREVPFYAYRHAVRPGISGWAAVNQGNVAEIEAANEKLQYDFYYIKYFSPWLDVFIAIKTVQTILTGFGSR
ncbi:sugar transferase [Sphingomonas sp.]|uniref:sugar transferase n=1 Tax=Sphingomonas sp. TaxID=28214 RepID=UPI0025F1AC44|nr:sugar transferase [Sphingomonas sp.]